MKKGPTRGPFIHFGSGGLKDYTCQPYTKKSSATVFRAPRINHAIDFLILYPSEPFYGPCVALNLLMVRTNRITQTIPVTGARMASVV